MKDNWTDPNEYGTAKDENIDYRDEDGNQFSGPYEPCKYMHTHVCAECSCECIEGYIVQ